MGFEALVLAHMAPLMNPTRRPKNQMKRACRGRCRARALRLLGVQHRQKSDCASAAAVSRERMQDELRLQAKAALKEELTTLARDISSRSKPADVAAVRRPADRALRALPSRVTWSDALTAGPQGPRDSRVGWRRTESARFPRGHLQEAGG